MSLRLTYQFVTGQFAQAFADIEKPIAKAATAAMNEAAQLAKTGGRANIAAAGFSLKWQNALRADVYPKGRDSLGPAALIHHKIPYSEIFEAGGTIQGQPLLWLPIDKNLPLQSGGKRWTPKTFAAAIGPLRLVKPPGRPPLLVADVAVGHLGVPLALPSRAQSRKGVRARGAFAREKTRPLPVFVGVPMVNIGKKFDIRGVVRGVVAKLGDLYLKNIRGAQNGG